MSNQLIHYVRNEKNEPTAVFLADQEADRVRIGWAMCHVGKDTFSKELGKKIALGRAIKIDQQAQAGMEINIPSKIREVFLKFIEYCLQQRSYQDKTFLKYFEQGTITD